jgi:hypothetical protein
MNFDSRPWRVILDIKTLQKTLLGMDSKVIPLQLLQLVKSPDFGILMMLPSDQLEHFQEVLNQKDPDELAIIPEAPMDLEIDADPPSKLEIQKAIKSLKNKTAPGTDQLNAELFKIDPVLGADALHPVFHKIWEKAVIHNSWSEGNIIRIPKSGELTTCNNRA